MRTIAVTLINKFPILCNQRMNNEYPVTLKKKKKLACGTTLLGSTSFYFIYLLDTYVLKCYTPLYKNKSFDLIL